MTVLSSPLPIYDADQNAAILHAFQESGHRLTSQRLSITSCGPTANDKQFR